MPAFAQSAAQVLLSALRHGQTANAWEAERSQSGVEWEDLAIRAMVFGLAPQLHYRLQRWGAAVPPGAAAKLAATYQATAYRNAAIYEQLGQLLVACDEHGAHPIALKGAHLAAAVYAHPALRPMSDIDLLFAPGELPAAEAALRSLGYEGKHKPAQLGAGVTKHTGTFQRPAPTEATPNPYLSAQANVMVEPHGSLEESWYGLRVDITPGMSDRAAQACLGGCGCRVLTPEDLLLHLCVHFCFHLIMGAPSMVQLTDLLTVVDTCSPDWAVFTSRVLDRRAAPYALAALTLASGLLGAPVPQSTLAALSAAAPGPLRARIARLGLADVLRRTQQKPFNNLAGRIWHGLADRAETARWAADWPSRWRVWQTALNVGSTDTGRMLLKMNNEQ